MGITVWPAIEERYALPAKFNLAIDGTGFCYTCQASYLVTVPWFHHLLTKAYEVCLLFDGSAPKQKIAERFKRKRNRAMFSEYFASKAGREPAFVFSQFTKRPLLIEESTAFGEAETKVLLCTAWRKPDLPILCIVNDNDFFQFLIHVPPYSEKAIENVSNFNLLGANLHATNLDVNIKDSPGPMRKITLSKEIPFLNYYKVDKHGVIDFWKPYSLTQRKHLVIWTCVCWGNDYIVGIAPSIKWDQILANIPDWDLRTYKNIVDSLISLFKFLKRNWPKKITNFSCLTNDDSILPENFSSRNELDELIQNYIEQIIWNLIYIMMNPSEPDYFRVKFKDGWVLSWPHFSHQIMRVSPIPNVISHCMEEERYYRLNCIRRQENSESSST